MPTNGTEWVELALLLAIGCSACFAMICLVALARRRWCLAAVCCVAGSFAAVVIFDYWQNSVATFPMGPFPRQRGFYWQLPLMALAALVGGVVDLSRFRKRGATNQHEAEPSAADDGAAHGPL
jgi:hypothetical protein